MLCERQLFTRFRIGSHKLEIERDRHINIQPENKVCEICNIILYD